MIKHVSFRMDGEITQIIHDYARFKGMSISEIIRKAVMNYIEDDMDSQYFQESIRWERINTRIEEVRKVYETLGMDPNDYLTPDGQLLNEMDHRRVRPEDLPLRHL